MSAGPDTLRATYANRAILIGCRVEASAAETILELACEAGVFAGRANPLASAAVAALFRSRAEGGGYPA